MSTESRSLEPFGSGQSENATAATFVIVCPCVPESTSA